MMSAWKPKPRVLGCQRITLIAQVHRKAVVVVQAKAADQIDQAGIGIGEQAAVQALAFAGHVVGDIMSA